MNITDQREVRPSPVSATTTQDGDALSVGVPLLRWAWVEWSVWTPRMLTDLAGAAPRKRVGLVGIERVPVREGTAIVSADGRQLGTVTSGTLAPTVNQAIAMAYLPLDHAQPHHEVYAEVRGKRLPMRVSPMPFNPHRYQR